MASTFGKLNLKDQKDILVLNAPESFEPELKALRGVTVHHDLKNVNKVEFSLAFVTWEFAADGRLRALLLGDLIIALDFFVLCLRRQRTDRGVRLRANADFLDFLHQLRDERVVDAVLYQ